MRQKILLGILGVVVVGAVLYFFWIVLKSLYTLFMDWLTRKQLDELAAAYDEKRRQKREHDAARLDNGCDHEYDDLLRAFPDDVCVKCGLAKTRPAGDCDHVWQRVPGPIPGSRCEKCGQTYGAAATASN